MLAAADISGVDLQQGGSGSLPEMHLRAQEGLKQQCSPSTVAGQMHLCLLPYHHMTACERCCYFPHAFPNVIAKQSGKGLSCAQRSVALKAACGNAIAATCGRGHQMRSPLNQASVAQGVGTSSKRQAEIIQCGSVHYNVTG